jgi:hypothetical protein
MTNAPFSASDFMARLSVNARNTLEAIGHGVGSTDSDARCLRGGMPPDELLRNCLRGVETDDVRQGWTEYVDALAGAVVDRLLVYADAYEYRKPRNANGSRARYFHAYLRRMAASRN